MSMIKLDSSTWINSDAIIAISTKDNLRLYDDSKVVMPTTKWYALIGQNGSTVDLTEADRDRIVEAMNSKKEKDDEQ